MKEFITEAGTHYIIDTEKQTITGGQLIHPVPYVKYKHIEVGERALIYFEDELLKTSIVKEILE